MRADFSLTTKRTIAGRAGYQCSFLSCKRTTIGPGAEPDETASSGIAAHIYGASPGGPRGQGNLTPDELSQPENGIWLCDHHARLVDTNDGKRFSAELLLSYKALQEARIQREQQGIYSPIGWLHEIRVTQSPLFSGTQAAWFGKLNLVYGNNETGKTALLEWIDIAFGGDPKRWFRSVSGQISCEISYLNPEPVRIDLNIDKDIAMYHRINSKEVPFVPIPLKIVKPSRFDWSEQNDDQLLAKALGVRPLTIEKLVEEIHTFPFSHIRNLRFETVKPDEDDDQGVEFRELRLDCDGTVPGLSFHSLSGREKERVLIEFATALARVSGRYTPTILFLDEVVEIVFKGWFDYYSHHFLDPENQFQTFLCLPCLNVELDKLRWGGWEVIRLEGQSPNVVISQLPRTGGTA